MSVLSMPPHHYLLVVHEGSGAAVWDLRAQLVVAVLSNGSSSGGGAGGGGSAGGVDSNGRSSPSIPSSRFAPITTAAWLPGSSKGDFATGHEDGAICIWEMPPSAGSSSSSSSSAANVAATSNGSGGSRAPGKASSDVLFAQQQLHPQQHRHSLQAQLVSQVYVSSSGASGGRASPGLGAATHHHSSSSSGGRLGGSRCRPVQSVEFVGGQVECLAVFGGNEVDRPDGLTLVPLPEPVQVSSKA